MTGFDAQRQTEVALSGAGRANEMQDLGAIDEAELGERHDAVLVERRLEGEVEAGRDGGRWIQSVKTGAGVHGGLSAVGEVENAASGRRDAIPDASVREEVATSASTSKSTRLAHGQFSPGDRSGPAPAAIRPMALSTSRRDPPNGVIERCFEGDVRW